MDLDRLVSVRQQAYEKLGKAGKVQSVMTLRIRLAVG